MLAPAVDETIASPPIDFYFFMSSNETHDSRPSADVRFHGCSPNRKYMLLCAHIILRTLAVVPSNHVIIVPCPYPWNIYQSCLKCSAAVSVELVNARPPPVLLDGYRLTTTASEHSQAFFLPVYYIYGSFIQGMDGTTDMLSDNTDGNVKSFGLFITRLPGSPTSFNVTSHQL